MPAALPRPREEALAELGRRWLPTRAPATAHDLAWWAGLPVADERALSRCRATGNGLVGAVVVAGRVAGTWQRALGRETVAIEARLLDRPTAATERALRAAARR